MKHNKKNNENNNRNNKNERKLVSMYSHAIVSLVAQ